MQSAVAQHTTSSQPVTLRIGTRTSKLALWQTNHVAALLQQRWPHVTCELVHLVTQGDKRLDKPLPEIGGKGLFTAELEDALRRGEIDLAVHSLKDLPVDNPADITLGAILSREDTRDVLVARQEWTLATLPHGAVIGTSSLRRQAQLLAARPDLDVRSIRGNVDTRLRKVMDGEYDAAVMAGAGLTRLGLTAHITQWLSEEMMLPAPGQGALGVQCREDDKLVRALLHAIHDPVASATTGAERLLLQLLGGGCSAPIGASATFDHTTLTLRARVTSVDGRLVFDAEATGSTAEEVAQRANASLLSQGAAAALNRDSSTDVPVLPLHGKRVVITRPDAGDNGGDANVPGTHVDGHDLAQLLVVAGAEVLHIPAIQLAAVAGKPAVDAARARLHAYDWVLFTSAAAVEYFWEDVAAPDKLVSGHGMRFAAVGPATRAALDTRGIRVDAMPETYRGREMVGELGDVAGKRILLPRSQQGSHELPAALRAAGAQVDELALYTPVGAPISEEARTRLAQGVDVVTFASGSAVRAFVAAVRGDARLDNFWAHTVVACIGPTTAEVAKEEGLRVEVIATEHTMPGLVAALAAFYAQQVTTSKR